jgi:thiol:disulfide interchange protein DsbD
MPNVAWSLFLTGIFLGVGPCLLSCGPLLISYIAGTQKDTLGGLRVYFIFSATRMFVYAVFGVLAGLFGEMVLQGILGSYALKIAFFVFGIVLLLLGVFIALDRFSLSQKYCGLIHKHLVSRDTKNVVIFGLIVSFAPCLPLLGVLGYIALISDTWPKGVIYMSSFGLGTVLSPMLILSMWAGWLSNIIKSRKWVLRIVNIICGIILVYLGITLILNTIRP